jgi:hypothetical protein
VTAFNKYPSREKGFVLVATLMILLILTIIGISATSTTMIELMIAGNDRIHKSSFFQADAGTELGERLAFENSVCATTANGFSKTPFGSSVRVGDNIIVLNPSFSQPTLVPPVTDINRDVTYFPRGSATGKAGFTPLAPPNPNDIPHTNLLYQETSITNPGAGLTMVAGYEGLGVGAVGGGVSALYTIDSQHMGMDNSQSIITVQWKMDLSILNSANLSDCNY